MTYTPHIPVLKSEVLDFFFTEKKEPFFLDLTFGGGGHSLSLLERYPKAKIFACDQDMEAFNHGQELIKKNKLEDRLFLFHTNLKDFWSLLVKKFKELEGKKIDGVLMDLGISSHHVDVAERGFSFMKSAKLDMRMNQEYGEDGSAYYVVNEYSAKELEKIFKILGEERFSKKISEVICEYRKKKPIETTVELADLIYKCYGRSVHRVKVHPATRCFQALRIFVNDELEILEENLEPFVSCLTTGGILAVISFHSLEDRIAKHTFRNLAGKKIIDILTKKPVSPQREEIIRNSRSRSAKLRVVRKR